MKTFTTDKVVKKAKMTRKEPNSSTAQCTFVSRIAKNETPGDAGDERHDNVEEVVLWLPGPIVVACRSIGDAVGNWASKDIDEGRRRDEWNDREPGVLKLPSLSKEGKRADLLGG